MLTVLLAGYSAIRTVRLITKAIDGDGEAAGKLGVKIALNAAFPFVGELVELDSVRSILGTASDVSDISGNVT